MAADFGLPGELGRIALACRGASTNERARSTCQRALVRAVHEMDLDVIVDDALDCQHPGLNAESVAD